MEWARIPVTGLSLLISMCITAVGLLTTILNEYADTIARTHMHIEAYFAVVAANKKKQLEPSSCRPAATDLSLGCASKESHHMEYIVSDLYAPIPVRTR